MITDSSRKSMHISPPFPPMNPSLNNPMSVRGNERRSSRGRLGLFEGQNQKDNPQSSSAGFFNFAWWINWYSNGYEINKNQL